MTLPPQFERQSQCPFCAARHDLATGISGNSAPHDGDLTLCIVCGEWAMFESAAPGGMRKPTDAEYEKINDMPITRAARRAWLETNKRFGRPRQCRG
jgi:hypothetical protein